MANASFLIPTSAERPAAPDAPMIVEGEFCPGDTELMTRCMVEELLAAGSAAAELEGMSLDPNYQAIYAARHTLGHAAFQSILNSAARRAQVVRFRVYEAPPTEFEAVLTINGSSDPTRSLP
jgi:hypothetical protein